MACMGASQLKHRIDILGKTSTRKAGGGFSETWSVSYTVWADIKSKKKNELLEARNLEQQSSHEITVRYDSNIFALETEDLRIRFDNRYMFVNSKINIDEEDDFIVFDVMESKKATVVVV